MKKEKPEIIVKICKITGKCKYHRKVGQEYSLGKIVPLGMCLDAFHVVYPYCLSLLYGATFSWMENIDKDAVIAQCPYASIVMMIKRFLKTEKKKIIIKVVEKRGECPENMEIGQEFKFNLGDDQRVLCPAGFNSIFPYISLIKSGEEKIIECPDHINRVVYKIKRRKK